MYYLVAVRSNRYHGQDPLTYASEERLGRGAIVQVELQNELVLGLVTATVSEPRFKTKPISRIYDLPPLPAHLLKLGQWLQAYYPAPLGVITQQFLPAQFTEKQLQAEDLAVTAASSKDTAKDQSKKPAKATALPPLTAEQQAAVAAMRETDSYLLHGVTGSGKTRLYIELAKRTLEAGKSVIVLTPEISLTSQLAANFRGAFSDSGSDRVVVMHSQQTLSARRAAWLRCLRSTEPLIVIGPRSALFSPLARPGLIILDESHEAAYKQDQAPHYQAGRVAAYLARLTRATLVLGSATPAVSDYYLAEQKHKPIIRLTKLAQADNGIGAAPELTIVDRKQLDLFGRSPHFSQPLIEALGEALRRGEQSLLYLNRRGTARMVMCQQCGWQARCPHCDLPLTYHGDRHQLRCHGCDYHGPVAGSCPACGHPDIVYKSAGTKAIVDEVQRLFPQARVARFDTDNLKAERFEQQYEAIKNGQADILVGTQLLAKGLDLPLLSTLGVLLADTSLYLPDFSAQERTFQLISQVLGRIGRGHVAGRAIVQTYHPDHPVLRAALAGDYQSFYQAELAERQKYLFPPFCYLLKLSVRRATIQATETAAEAFKQHLLSGSFRVRVEGPAPCFYERFQNKFQWQLVVKARERSELLRIIHQLPANWSYDIDPLDLL